MGLTKFEKTVPVRHGVLPELRKSFSMEIVMEITNSILSESTPTAEHINDKEEVPTEQGNLGTLILDATCSPSNIRYPQDFSLLNQAREFLDKLIDEMHPLANEKLRPRTYRKTLRKEFLAMAKSKRRDPKKLRALIFKLLCAVKRNMNYVDAYMANGLKPKSEQDIEKLKTIRILYAQQKEMFDANKRNTNDRIVSLEQPFIRPIVRGKAKTPVEFGVKYQVSIDEKGHARLDSASFDQYNEAKTLIDALERYKSLKGCYPNEF